MSVGSRIADLRREKGWSQAKLAEIAQLSASSVAMYETNRRTPDSIALSKLAVALDVRLAELEEPVSIPAARAETAQAAIDLTTFSLTREEARIILFLRLNKDSLAFIEDFITADQNKREQLESTWRLIQKFQV